MHFLFSYPFIAVVLIFAYFKCKFFIFALGKIIGAATHILVDDSTKGYGIFAENMLETVKTLGDGLPLPKNDKQLKDAS